MDTNEITISRYIREKLLTGREEIVLSPEDDLLGSGLLDSMGVMRLVAFLEETFNKKIPPEDIVIEHFMNVKSISDYVAS